MNLLLKNTWSVSAGLSVLLMPFCAYASSGFQWATNGLYILYFILLAGLAVYLLKKKKIIGKILAQRSVSIEESVKDAKDELEKAELKMNEWKMKMDSLSNEIQALKDDFRKQGEIERDRIMKDSMDLGEKIKADMSFRISQEARILERECRYELIEMALAKASDTLKEKMDSKLCIQMLDESIEDIEKYN
jgi:F-type H+-transporting ATPase subunit b